MVRLWTIINGAGSPLVGVGALRGA